VKGRIIDFSMSWNRKQRITIEVDTDFREGYEALKESDVEVSIKKWRKKRSNDANAYFHVLVNAIAEARGVSNDEIKRMLVVDYGSLARDEDGQIIGFKLPVSVDVSSIYPYTKFYKQVEENGKLFNCYLVYKHSHEMDTKEMARLIDGAVQEAKELGIDTDTPEERARWAERITNGGN